MEKTKISRSWFLDDSRWDAVMIGYRVSGRERQLIEQLLLMRSDDMSIALALGISKHTVHTYMTRLFRKVSVTTRAGLVARLFSDYVAVRPAATNLSYSRDDGR